MDPAAKEFLVDLLQTPSPTGFEIHGQRKWAAYVTSFADAVESDAYGTTWATLTSEKKGAPRLMLEAHADEIGYMVKYISADGFLYLDRMGGSDNAVGRGRRLAILGDKGPVRGIIGNTAIHIRERKDEKAPEVHELYVDVGAANPKEVAKLGLRVGHPAVYADSVEEFGAHRLVGRALDNRIGGFILAQVLKRLSKHRNKLHCTVLAVNSVQEEIGGHGARMVTHRLMPDVAICLDVTHATDTPGIDKAKHGSVKLGGGPSLTHGSACHPKVVSRLMSVAEKSEIPIQHEASSRFTGTDTDRIFSVGNGVPSALVSLPLRYMHSVVESVDLRDVSLVVELLTSFALSVKTTDTFGHEL